MKFVDQARIRVISGKGGRGCVSFRREAFVPKGGPDGGDGGKGGDIVIRADRSLSSLLDCRYQQLYKANDGKPGRGSQCQGRSGMDLVIRVPIGTVVWDEETGESLADLDQDQKSVIAARGGRGGRGNTRFATPWDRAPRRYDAGGSEEEKHLRLELKLIAAIGLVGLPNSGKSTLISKVSKARPKIADYPFTTTIPVLGVVRVGDDKDLVMADIPGLIEGAHQGAGMGHQFLRHIERTRVLLHLVDPSPMLEPGALERFEIVMRELASYSDDLANRPMIAVITKMDLPDNEAAAAELEPLLRTRCRHVHRISALTGLGVQQLLHDTARLYARTCRDDAGEPKA